MAAVEAEVHEETESDRIERWRCEALVKAGYERKAAAKLAASREVDLHQAIDLLERGCEPKLAVKILL